VDGVSDISFTTSPYLTTSCPSTDIPEHAENVRRASYNLNRTKQVTKLANDAMINDFEINVSPTEQNVNIICSTGFYSLVVLPAFSSVFKGYSTTAAGVQIYCYDLTGKVDAGNSTVNTVIFYKLNFTSSGKSNNVTITLHHTVRKVQVQGSSIINNSTRANVWFLENILLDMFSTVSVTKALDISNFNTQVRNVVPNHVQKLN
jgi:hypothetical protein